MNKLLKKHISAILLATICSSIFMQSSASFAEDKSTQQQSNIITSEEKSKTSLVEKSIKKGKVNTTSLNVRKSPSTSSAKIGSLKNGETVEIISTSNGWHKIKFNNNYGYVSSKYITILSDSNSNDNTNISTKVTHKGTVNTTSLNVRSNASTSSAKLGSLKKGSTVNIIGAAINGWYKIEFKNGYGYVSSQYISNVTPVDSSSEDKVPNLPVIKTGVVNTDKLNVRKSASTNDTKIGSLTRNTKVQIVEVVNNNWYKIKFNNGYGFVSSTYITISNGSNSNDRVYQNPPGYIQIKDSISVPSVQRNLIKGTMGLRVAKVQRKLGMGYQWEVVGMQTMSKVMAFQRSNGLKATGIVDLTTWKKLGFSESQWYSLDTYVTPVKTNRNSTRSDLVEQMIATAKSYLGTEYVVGAAGVPGSGIDCSGLVMQSLYSIGIDPAPVSVTRHSQPGYEYESRNLWNLPTLKTVSTPKRGDLVFYKNSSGTIIHVAIYLGNNRVIEAWPEKVVEWPLIHPERPLIKGYKRVLG